MQSDTGRALLRGVLENPYDDAPRLVYADWLDDYDGTTPEAEQDPDRAELIRLMIGPCRTKENHDPRKGAWLRCLNLVQANLTRWVPWGCDPSWATTPLRCKWGISEAYPYPWLAARSEFTGNQFDFERGFIEMFYIHRVPSGYETFTDFANNILLREPLIMIVRYDVRDHVGISDYRRSVGLPPLQSPARPAEETVTGGASC